MLDDTQKEEKEEKKVQRNDSSSKLMSVDSSIQVQAPDKSIDFGISSLSIKESTIRPKANKQDEINDDKENLSEESLSSDDPPAVPVNIDPLSVRNVEFQSERALMDKSDRKSA